MRWIRGYSGDIPNARIVFSIREDDLYRLEDLLDRNNIDQMKETRYRLRDITKEGARLVLMAVANKNGIKVESGLFEKLVKKITSIEKKYEVNNEGNRQRHNVDENPIYRLLLGNRKSGKFENNNDKVVSSMPQEPVVNEKEPPSTEKSEVSTLILSLCCNRMYRSMIEGGREEEEITYKDLDSLGDDPLFTYYQEATEGMSLRKLKYLEKMAPSGYRVPKSKKELLDILGKKDFKKLASVESDKRILTLSSKKSGTENNCDSDENRNEEYELLHDRLARSIYDESKRLQQEQRRKAEIWGLIGYAIIVFTLGPFFVLHLLNPPTERILEHGTKKQDYKSQLLYTVPNGHLELLTGDTVPIDAIDASTIHKITFRGGILADLTRGSGGNLQWKPIYNMTFLNVDTVVIGSEGTGNIMGSLFLPNARFAVVEKQENIIEEYSNQYIIAPKLEQINCIVDSSDALRWSCGTLYKKFDDNYLCWKVLIISKNSALTETDTTAIDAHDALYDPLDFPDGETVQGYSIIEYDLANPPKERNFLNYYRYRLVYNGASKNIRISYHDIDPIRNRLYEIKLTCDITLDTGVFSNCPKLSKVDISGIASVPDRAFKNCPLLNEVSLPKATEIGNDAFYRDSKLYKIDIPNVRVVRYRAFSDCVSLKKVNIPLVDSIGRYAFSHSGLCCADFPKLVFIGSGAFSDCQKLVWVDFPEYAGGESTDQSEIFWGCRSLSSVSLPSLIVATDKMFQCCISLKELELPKLKRAGEESFKSCEKLRHVDFPLLEKIDEGDFQDCYLLDNINLPNVEYIPYEVFRNCYSLQSVSLPRVKKIGNHAFQDCFSLKVVDFPNVVNLGYYTFKNCIAIEYINLPNLKHLEYNEFLDQSNLKVINLPRLERMDNPFFLEAKLHRGNVDLYLPQEIISGNHQELGGRIHINDTTYTLPENIYKRNTKRLISEDIGYSTTDSTLVIYGDTIDCLRVSDKVNTVVVCNNYPIIKRIMMPRKKMRFTYKLGYGSWFVCGCPLYVDNDKLNITFNHYYDGYTLNSFGFVSNRFFLPPNTKIAFTTSWDIDYSRLPQDCVLQVPYGHRNQYLKNWPNVEEMSRWETWKRLPVSVFGFVFSVPELLQLAIAILYIIIIWFVFIPPQKRLRYLWMFAVLVGAYSLAVVGSWQGWGPLAYIGYPMHINMAELSLAFCVLWTIWITIIWAKNNQKKFRSIISSLVDNTFVNWVVKIYKRI